MGSGEKYGLNVLSVGLAKRRERDRCRIAYGGKGLNDMVVNERTGKCHHHGSM